MRIIITTNSNINWAIHSPETEYRWPSAVAVKTTKRTGNTPAPAIFEIQLFTLEQKLRQRATQVFCDARHYWSIRQMKSNWSLERNQLAYLYYTISNNWSECSLDDQLYLVSLSEKNREHSSIGRYCERIRDSVVCRKNRHWFAHARMQAPMKASMYTANSYRIYRI